MFKRSPNFGFVGLANINRWFSPQVVFFREDLPEKTPQKNLLFILSFT
jgi:hypothetical protein